MSEIKRSAVMHVDSVLRMLRWYTRLLAKAVRYKDRMPHNRALRRLLFEPRELLSIVLDQCEVLDNKGALLATSNAIAMIVQAEESHLAITAQEPTEKAVEHLNEARELLVAQEGTT